MNIQQIIENTKFYSTGSVTIEEIKTAESELSTTFPDDYKEILLTYGALSIGSHEINGLGVTGYLNVVTATESERKLSNDSQLDQLIVIENIGAEGVLIVLDEDGQVYQYAERQLKWLYNGLAAYLKMEVCL